MTFKPLDRIRNEVSSFQLRAEIRALPSVRDGSTLLSAWFLWFLRFLSGSFLVSFCSFSKFARRIAGYVTSLHND